MIKAVLFDMDGTLINLDADLFTGFLGKTLVKKVLTRFPDRDPNVLGEGMSKALLDVARNTDPLVNNTQVYRHALANRLDVPFDLLDEIAVTYYISDYLKFPGTVSTADGAERLLNRTLDMGLTLVLATVPIFPRSAIVQRLIWAKLDPALHLDQRVALITDIDEMHFYKGQPHYYEEILARIGVETDEAIMVGDNLREDIIPAAKAGLNTFWIGSGVPDGVEPDGIGTLADFDNRVAEGWLSTLKPHPHTAEQLIPRMMANVAAADSLIRDLNPDFWRMRPDPDEWSPLEIVCHLRESERLVQRPRLEKILNEDNPFVSSPKEPPMVLDLDREDGQTALREWWTERCKTLTFLETLTDADYARPARHSIFGPTTLLEMAHFTARHDRLHVSQLCQTIGRCKQASSVR